MGVPWLVNDSRGANKVIANKVRKEFVWFKLGREVIHYLLGRFLVILRKGGKGLPWKSRLSKWLVDAPRVITAMFKNKRHESE